MFNVKKLQKLMTYEEVNMYLDSHKKYRLLDISELISQNINELTFNLNSYSFNTIEDGAYFTLVSVFDVDNNQISHVNPLIKLPVYLTYSDEYLEFYKECLSHLSKADPMVTGNILLKRMIEEYL